MISVVTCLRWQGFRYFSPSFGVGLLALQASPMLIPRASVGRTGDSLQPSQRAVGDPGGPDEFGKVVIHPEYIFYMYIIYIVILFIFRYIFYVIFIFIYIYILFFLFIYIYLFIYLYLYIIIYYYIFIIMIIIITSQNCSRRFCWRRFWH